MRTFLPLVLLAASAAPALAQDPDSTRGPGGGGAARVPRPYERVITAEARTKRGLFSVHRVGDRLYFEIPRRELGRDQLLIGRYARAAAPSDGGGGGEEEAGAQPRTPATSSPSARSAGSSRGTA